MGCGGIVLGFPRRPPISPFLLLYFLLPLLLPRDLVVIFLSDLLE